jgi:hypothetical protein
MRCGKRRWGELEMGRGGSIRFVLGGDYKWGNEVKGLTVVSPPLLGPVRVVTLRTQLGEYLTPALSSAH